MMARSRTYAVVLTIYAVIAGTLLFFLVSCSKATPVSAIGGEEPDTTVVGERPSVEALYDKAWRKDIGASIVWMAFHRAEVDFYEVLIDDGTSPQPHYFQGVFQVAGNTLYMSDPTCSGAQGAYVFLAYADSLSMEVAQDPCTGRGRAVTGTWHRDRGMEPGGAGIRGKVGQSPLYQRYLYISESMRKTRRKI